MTDVTTAPQPLVRIRDLRRVFRKDGAAIEVLRGVDLDIYRGESLSIMGRSGAGKSTFLQVLGTLDRPDTGTVMFENQDVFSLNDQALSLFRGRRIGFVFQFHHLLPEFTTLENAAMPAIVQRIPRAKALERAAHWLDRVGLAHRLGHKPGELSGGEQQRVALARALVMEPSLVLADEPTGNLDEETGAIILDLFGEIHRELGTAVVIVTHSPRLAASMGRALTMVEGRLLETSAAAMPGESC